MSTSRKTLLRYLLALAGSALLTAVAMALVVRAMPMHIYEESYPMYEYTRRMERAEPGRAATTLIIGDSRAKASLLPERLGPGALSLTLPGGSAIELYFAAEHYLSAHPAPANVVVSISAVHFSGDYIFWERPVKFGYLADREVAQVLSDAERLHDDTLGSPRQARWNFWLHRYNAPHLYLAELRAALFRPHRRANQELLARLEQQRGHCLFGQAERSDALAYENGVEHFQPSSIYDHYFHKLIDRLRATGARVTFVAMPMNGRSLTAMKPTYRQEYERYFAGLARQYPDVSWRASWPVLSDDQFGDGNHVNSRGSQAVTAMVRELLRL